MKRNGSGSTPIATQSVTKPMTNTSTPARIGFLSTGLRMIHSMHRERTGAHCACYGPARGGSRARAHGSPYRCSGFYFEDETRGEDVHVSRKRDLSAAESNRPAVGTRMISAYPAPGASKCRALPLHRP